MSKEGAFSPGTQPRELCPKWSGREQALRMVTEERGGGDMERSHTHLGRTDVGNTDPEREHGGPGVTRINTPEQHVFRPKDIRGKNNQREL